MHHPNLSHSHSKPTEEKLLFAEERTQQICICVQHYKENETLQYVYRKNETLRREWRLAKLWHLSTFPRSKKLCRRFRLCGASFLFSVTEHIPSLHGSLMQLEETTNFLPPTSFYNLGSHYLKSASIRQNFVKRLFFSAHLNRVEKFEHVFLVEQKRRHSPYK